MGEPFRADAQAAYPVAAWFAQADADHDGRLGSAEMVADADRFFARLDLDHDGEIIPVELSDYENKVAPEIRLWSPRGFGPQAEKAEERARRKRDEYGGPLGAGRWSLLNTPQPVAAADEDFNRGISRAEFLIAARARFAQLDKTKRSFLDLAGLPLTPAQDRAVNCTPPKPTAQPKGAR